MFTLFEILINLFEAWLILTFIKSKIYIPKENHMVDLIFIAVCTSFYSLSLLNIEINEIIIIIFPVLYALIMSSDKWYVSVFWSIILMILFSSTASLYTHAFSLLFSVEISALMEPHFLRIIFLITSNAVLYCIIHSASKLCNNTMTLSWPALLTFLAVSIGILIAEECFYRLQQTVGGEASVYILGNTCLLL